MAATYGNAFAHFIFQSFRGPSRLFAGDNLTSKHTSFVHAFGILCVALSLELAPTTTCQAQEAKAAKPEIPETPARKLVKEARVKLAEGKLDAAVQLADQALTLEANQPEAITTKGMVLAARRQFTEAMAEYDKVTALTGREPATLLAKADAHTQRSHVLRMQGDSLEAVNAAYYALLEKADHVEARLARSLAYIDRGQFDRAINHCNAAIGADKDSAEAYSLRGYAYQMQGNVAQAIADQKKALELNSNLAEAYQRRASALAAKGDGNESMQDLEQAIKLTLPPGQPDVLCDRASLYAMAKDKVHAMADIEEALKLDPNCARAYLLKGMAQTDLKEYDAAIASFSEVIKLQEKKAEGWYYRGRAKLAKKDPAAAVEDFTKAIELNKNLIMAYEGRNDAYKKLKKTKESAADFAKIKELQAADPKLAAKKPAGTKAKEEPIARFLVSSKPVDPAKLKQAMVSAKEIDRLVSQNYEKYKLTANPKTTDEQFVRRVYLDVTGTIPTYQQTVAFLSKKDADKRSKLIDELLGSDGYASHSFNYWADVLRYTDILTSDLRGEPYRQWIKQSLAENKPWDVMVHEMLTAEGLVWENPATGYLQRDSNMPLDNMNNTIRIFLGTRIGCAQCHDHPFDRWTQKEFYEIAAFTFGTQTATGGGDTRYWAANPSNRLSEEYAEIEQEEEDRRNLSYRFDRFVAINMKIVNDVPSRQITLPKDYQYDNGKPGDVVIPKVLFGTPVEVKAGETPRTAFARWATSKDNPRFALTIANRLWKQCFGVGQIEPVDDMMDSTEAENPALMSYLESEMKRLNFDMKEYLRIILNSETYQQQVTSEEILPGQPYHFTGPILRRMSAEQVWDSFLTLAVVKPDEYRELPATERTRFQGVDLEKVSAVEVMSNEKKVLEVDGQRYQREKKYTYKGLLLARASELPSPVPPNHFLRMFGQSDRELISSSSTNGSVPQVLMMFNGPITHMLLEKNTTIFKNVMSHKDSGGGVRVIFLTILNREPDKEELDLAKQEVKNNGPAGFGNVIWSLVNTREFLFVQ